DRYETTGLKKMMIIDACDRSEDQLLEVSDLVHDVLRTAGAPLLIIEDRDVTEHAGPRTPTRGLHAREALHGQDRGHIEGHRLDKIQRQTVAIRERPLIEIALHQAVRVVHDVAVLRPGQPSDVLRIVQMLHQIENELFTITSADKI